MGIAYRLYSAGRFLWVLLVAGAFVALETGIAADYVPGARLPTSTVTGAAGAAGLAVAGALVLGHLRLRAWRGIGRRIGLEPDGATYTWRSRISGASPGPHRRGSVPDLVGTVDGRSVRVTTYHMKGSSGEAGGRSSRTYTVVRADLSEPVDVGTLITRRGEDEDFDVPDAVPGEIRRVPVGDEFAVVGEDNAAFARDVLTDRVRSLLLDPAYPGAVGVGDKTDALMEAVPDTLTSVMNVVPGDGVAERIRSHPSNDPSGVTYSTRGLVTDADDLERQVELVVAVADAVERATTESVRV